MKANQREDRDNRLSTEVTIKIIKTQILPSRNLKSSALFFNPPLAPKNTLRCITF